MPSESIRVAVLLNGAPEHRAKVEASFRKAITTVAAAARVDFYDPIHAQVYPDVTLYDLVVLSGGSVDPMSKEPWVLKMQDFLRGTRVKSRKTKILGICWGHQTIAVAFGGSVKSMSKAEIGVKRIALTSRGSSFLNTLPGTDSYNILEFHGREIEFPGEGFLPLAENNQSFISADNQILTFQGHPEIEAEFARLLLSHAPAYMGVEDGNRPVISKELGQSHDGLAIWEKIIAWTNEPVKGA